MTLRNLCKLNLYTACNIIRYTNLNIYCDETNGKVAKQFVAEHLLTLRLFLQVFNTAAPGYAADMQTIF
jgi:hypothetical protein